MKIDKEKIIFKIYHFCYWNIFHPQYNHYWIPVDDEFDAFDCCNWKCDAMVARPTNYCPKCGRHMKYVRVESHKLITLKEYRKRFEND